MLAQRILIEIKLIPIPPYLKLVNFRLFLWVIEQIKDCVVKPL
jgi:hypothetical protein